MGDLSGKFGTLDNRRKYIDTYNDTLLPLFGPNSILGRSIVIHKKDQNLRWLLKYFFQLKNKYCLCKKSYLELFLQATRHAWNQLVLLIERLINYHIYMICLLLELNENGNIV